jgi:hypothetical protein
VAQRKTLTEDQVAVLRWIGEGCPPEKNPGEFHRISAAALSRRGLVEISGRRAKWAATLTDEGRDYLAKVDGPDPPIARQANVSVTQQLVDEVIAAGGTLRVPSRWGRSGGVDYAARARLAEGHRKVPPGHRLEVRRLSNEELEIALVDAPGVGEAELVEIVVPEKVARYHPAVRAFRKDKASHRVSREALTRASLILDAVFREAERRDWKVEGAGASDEADGFLRIEVEDQVFWLGMAEGGVGSRGDWEAEIEHHRRMRREFPHYSGDGPAKAYDAEADGKLTLSLGCEKSWRYGGRQSNWSDRSSWTLEERLPHLFVEIAERGVEGRRLDEEERVAAEEATAREKREREERETRWNELMEDARSRLLESHRAAQLDRELAAWKRADRIRSYCDALQESQGTDKGTVAWIDWCRRYADSIDPTNRPTGLPEDPEVTHGALQEHLPHGWSTYGPEHGWQPRSSLVRRF